MFFFSYLNDGRDAGMKDTLIQSGVVAEGFIESVMKGKMYNRSIRANKVVYEALLRMLLEKFQNQQSVTSYTEEINQLHQNLDQETYQSILRNERFTSYYNEFEIFLNKLTEDNPLAELWLSYIDMMTIILNIIYATRSGNWKLYISSLKYFLPWVFAYDRFNYSRYMTVCTWITCQQTTQTCINSFSKDGLLFK